MRRPALHAAKLLSLGLLPLSLPACAAGSVGTLAGRTIDTPSAHVVSIYSLGLELRIRSEDAGFSFGFRHSVYLYPKLKTVSADTPHFFFVAAEARPPLKVISQTIGLELGATPTFSGLELGYAERAVSSVPVHESRTSVIHYESAHFENTKAELVQLR